MAVAFGGLLMVPPGTSAGFLRQDPDDSNYLVGRLTWNQGEGAISWSGAASEDPGGPGSDVANDVYVSEPLPRTVHVNASRLIQLDVYTQNMATNPALGTSCWSPAIGASIFLDDRLVGGLSSNLTYQSRKFDAGDKPGQVVFPADPPGYGVCRIRIGAEMGVLPQGSRLKVQVTHARSNFHHLYGMSGDHQSVLRIPYFAEEDVLYRYPSYAHGAPGGASGAGPAVAGVLSGIGLGGLAAVVPGAMGRPSPRRRRVGLLLALLLAASILGGCMGRAPNQPSGAGGDGVQPTSVSPVYQRASVSTRGLGALTGQVASSDTGAPVQGAYVALLGTNNASRTDGYGRFVFKNLEAGAYDVRIDREGYHSFEARVAVVADLIARVNVTLVPLDGAAASRPHFHDYWGGAASRRVMEPQPLGVEPGVSGAAAMTCPGFGVNCVRVTSFRIPPPTSAEEYSSVLPGTYEVNVTLDWDVEETRVRSVSLLVQANNDPAPGNWTPFLARGPREPFHITTTWEMGDPGHQHFSTWTFQVIAVDAVTPPAVDTDPAGYATYQVNSELRAVLPVSEYTATLEVTKGVVPLEPPHRDFWGGRDALDIIQPEARPALIRWPIPPKDGYQVQWWNIAWLPRVLVPPGTTWLEATVTPNRTVFPAYELELRYKTASTGAPTALCWSAGDNSELGSRCDVPDPGYHTPTGGLTSGGSTKWVIHVPDPDADPFYAHRSFWVFGIQPHQDPATAAENALDRAVGGSLAYSLTVVAHRDPMPT